MLFKRIFVPLLTLAIVSSASASSDPFIQSSPGAIGEMTRAAEFGEPGADAKIADWLTRNPNASNSDRRQLENRLCSDYDVRSAHAAAAMVCAAATKLGADDAQDAANSALLNAVPPIRVVGSTRIPLVLNGLGSRDASVTVNGVSAPWIMDTGAELSVVSSSLAQRIGVRLLGKIEVGSTTGDVRGELGVIDLLRVGDARVENVPVLVLPDVQLKIGDLPQIQAILGLPVFVAFRRAAWLDGGKSLALGEMAPLVSADRPRLYWHEEGLGIPVSTALGTRGAHLDTGANASYLRAPIHVLLDSATEASAREHSGKMGGAGGVVDVRQKVYPRVALSVAGVPLTLTNLSIEEGSQKGVARLGDDVVRRLARLVLDFEQMRVDARALPVR